jgi:WD40 repeat protein
MGHLKAVRDINFSNDGRRFLSAGFDKQVLLWDTEYGKVIRSFTNNKTPFCVKFHPADDKQNIFLAGCANKKVRPISDITSLLFRSFNSTLIQVRLQCNTKSISDQSILLLSLKAARDLFPRLMIKRFTCGNLESLSWPSILVSLTCKLFQRPLCTLMESTLQVSQWITRLSSMIAKVTSK